MGYIGMCGSKGYGFSAVLFINRVTILIVFNSNAVMMVFFPIVSNWVSVLVEAIFLSIQHIDRPILLKDHSNLQV